MSAENEIRKASDKFYVALNRMLNGDPRPMVDVWSHKSDVSTMHPIGGSQIRLGRGPRVVGESGQDLFKWAAQTE